MVKGKAGRETSFQWGGFELCGEFTESLRNDLGSLWAVVILKIGLATPAQFSM
jgi:hypothetical protein